MRALFQFDFWASRNPVTDPRLNASGLPATSKSISRGPATAAMSSVAPPHTAATDFLFPFSAFPRAHRQWSASPRVRRAFVSTRGCVGIHRAFARRPHPISSARANVYSSSGGPATGYTLFKSDMPVRPTTLAREGRAACSDALSDVLPPSSCDYRVGAVPNFRAHQFNRPRGPSKTNRVLAVLRASRARWAAAQIFFNALLDVGRAGFFFVIARIPPRAWSPRVLLQLARTIPVVPATSKFLAVPRASRCAHRDIHASRHTNPSTRRSNRPSGISAERNRDFFFRFSASGQRTVGDPPPAAFMPDACRDIIF
ncbi:hypothetical protein B0H15DRAFT_953418 [Mycena belliarum]|uniref:Uncharacterized protein n=1 Tax=Mycena belliarum TaxID=1033014 RepID=A0AAD6XIB8_9AGAR|nr:hypothetical protein B0H15DRAFT_953418 [Mycena belliae]